MSTLITRCFYTICMLTVINLSAQKSQGDMYADSVQTIRTNAKNFWVDKNHPTGTGKKHQYAPGGYYLPGSA